MKNQTHNQPNSTGNGNRDVAAMLKEQGVLPTQQRLMIARVLFTRDQHLSAEQVMNLVNDGKARVSKATVYNTLGLFARKGLVREVIIDPTRIFYDSNVTAHHHFYNMDTGELHDIDASAMGIDMMPELPAGTSANGVDIIIRLRNKSTKH
jgi:Fur family iron response transcriptional regulator